jgi:flagellar basal-body rod modification protein FlgD
MASVGTTLPTTNTDPTTSGANSQNSTNSLGNESTFLNLLVAQLQNQDPTNPVDGTTFVTQLAEFNNVQQSLAIRQDMDAVSDKYLGTTTPPSDQTNGSTSGATSTTSA